MHQYERVVIFILGRLIRAKGPDVFWAPPLISRTRKVDLRVDRLDPSKNVVRGFMAYQTLLRRWPELRGRVHLLAFLTPPGPADLPHKRSALPGASASRHIDPGLVIWRTSETDDLVL